MTKVAILPVVDDGGGLSFRAVAGDRQSLGRTAGEALDALNAQFPRGERRLAGDRPGDVTGSIL